MNWYNATNKVTGERGRITLIFAGPDADGKLDGAIVNLEDGTFTRWYLREIVETAPEFVTLDGEESEGIGADEIDQLLANAHNEAVRDVYAAIDAGQVAGYAKVDEAALTGRANRITTITAKPVNQAKTDNKNAPQSPKQDEARTPAQ